MYFTSTVITFLHILYVLFFINVYMILFLFNNVIYVFLLLWLILYLCMSTMTEVFPCFFLSCKANSRVKPAKTGHGPALFPVFVLFYIFFCVVLPIFVLFYVVLCCSMYCLFCDVLCIICVYMCTEQLPLRGCPIAVKYIILTHLLAPWSRVLLEKLTSKLCS